MSYKPGVLFRCIFSLLFVLLFIQCEHNNNTKEQGEYLVDYQKIRELTAAEIKTQLSLASIYYPELSDLAVSNQYGISIYKLSYKTSFSGNEIIASGLICIPKSNAAFPVVSFQPGTNTCNANAPTVNSSDPLTSLIGVLAGNGYIITIPDYIGFGESSEILHPYIHRNSSDQAVIDMLNAAMEFLDLNETNAQQNGKLYLMGYSQGGWATLSALKSIEKMIAFPLQPVAASCGAGSYDLTQMTETLLEKTVYSFPLYLAYFIYSRIENGILTQSTSTYFKAPHTETIPDLFDGNHCNSIINSELSDTLANLLTANVFTLLSDAPEVIELKNELISNSVETWNTEANIYLFHSKGDSSISYRQSETLYNRFIESGLDQETISLELIDSLDHGEAVIPWGIQTFTWFDNLKQANDH